MPDTLGWVNVEYSWGEV